MATNQTSNKHHDLVILDYNDLVNGVDVSKEIEKAYGFDGLGILAVKNVPNLKKIRGEALPMAHTFANLPEDIKNKTAHKESSYSFGWSHGKEMLEGKPDYSKGSYYNNPTYDEPFTDAELIKKYPSFCNPNIWPKEDLPEFEHKFKAMSNLLVEVGMLVAKQCDIYVHSKNPEYPKDKLFSIIKGSKTNKARLLHYFPVNTDVTLSEEDYSSWCGWHNDHGSLTGLTCAMYINADGKEVPNPDPTSGLYIRARDGTLVKGAIPPDCLAYQIGETAQVHSGGILQATPHCVRAAQGAEAKGVSRDTMAVFMEPMWDEKMNLPKGAQKEAVLRVSSTKYLPKGVPLLETRWEETMDFGQFTEKTLSSFY